MSLVFAAASGSELNVLRALRDDLAQMLGDCESARDYAALSLRLMDAVERISVLEADAPEQEGTVLDDLAKRRAARIAGAAG